MNKVSIIGTDMDFMSCYSMKKDIAEYVAVCDVCERVKAKYQKPAGLLPPMPIPEWKWDKLGMDFITGLPRTRSG